MGYCIFFDTFKVDWRSLCLNQSGLDGYIFPFVIATLGYLIGLPVIHRLSPKPVSGL